jgi:hypothetical protein
MASPGYSGGASRERTHKRGEFLAQPNLDDRLRLELLGQVLTEERILLVLDDFEANLATGGGTFLDDDVATYLRFLAERARHAPNIRTKLLRTRACVSARCASRVWKSGTSAAWARSCIRPVPADFASKGAATHRRRIWPRSW